MSFSLLEPAGQLIALVGAIVGLVPALMGLRRAVWAGRSRLGDAEDELKDRLTGRLAQDHRSDLLTATSIRGLARSVEETLESPALTDPQIASTLRQVALQQEKYLGGGEELMERYRLINCALKEFDPSGPPLMSIASVDRLRAYMQSSLAIAFTTLAIQVFLIANGSVTHPVGLAGVLLLNLVYVWLFVSHRHATRQWSGDGGDVGDGSSSVVSPHKATRQRIGGLLLAGATTSNERRIATQWAPIWEEMLFRLLIPLLIGGMVFVGIEGFADPLASDNRMAMTISLAAALGVAAWLFAVSHEFQPLETRRLRRRLATLDRDRELAHRGIIEPSESNLLQEATEISERLWVLTGDPQYRKRPSQR